MVQLSHPCMTTGKTITLTIWTFVDKVMSVLFNMLSKLVIAFLPRSKCLLISWLQSPSAVILESWKMACYIFTILLFGSQCLMDCWSYILMNSQYKGKFFFFFFFLREKCSFLVDMPSLFAKQRRKRERDWDAFEATIDFRVLSLPSLPGTRFSGTGSFRNLCWKMLLYRGHQRQIFVSEPR